MSLEENKFKKTLWLVTVYGKSTYYNLVVSNTKQKAKELAKGVGHKEVEYICETDSFQEDKLILYI